MEKKTVTQCYNEIVANEYGSDLKLKFKPATNGKFGSGKVDIIDTVNNLMMESNYSIQEDDMKQINLVKLHLKINGKVIQYDNADKAMDIKDSVLTVNFEDLDSTINGRLWSVQDC